MEYDARMQAPPRPDLLASLVSTHDHRLRRMLVRLVRDPGAIDDVIQETWLRAAFEPGIAHAADPFPWLARVARNLALNHLRDTSRRRMKLAVHADEIRPWQPPCPAGLVEEREARRQLEASIELLPIVLRPIADLVFLRGMGQTEAAKMLGIPVKTATTRVWRIRLWMAAIAARPPEANVLAFRRRSHGNGGCRA